MQIKKIFNLISAIKEYFEITPFEHIIPWAEKNIDFSKDVSAERNYLDFDLYPYQVDIIKEWEDLNSIKSVVVCMPEQMRLLIMKNEHVCCWLIVANGFCSMPRDDCLSIRCVSSRNKFNQD